MIQRNLKYSDIYSHSLFLFSFSLSLSLFIYFYLSFYVV